MELSEELGGNMLNFAIYTPGNIPVYTATYPGDIAMVDSTHFALTIPHSVTRKFFGTLTARLCVCSSDLTLVNAGEQEMAMEWDADPLSINPITE